MRGVKKVKRADLVHDGYGLVEAAKQVDEEQIPEWIAALDKKVKSETMVANAQMKNLGNKADPDSVRSLTSHQKMKLVQDYWATAFLQPEIRQAFLMAAHKDPMAFAKIMAALMPKELNVEVTKREGVILLPVRMDSVEEWEKAVMAQMAGQTIEGETVSTSNTESWEELVYGKPGLPGDRSDVPDPAVCVVRDDGRTTGG